MCPSAPRFVYRRQPAFAAASGSGAKVFSAPAFTLGGHANYDPIATILDNLYRKLASP